LSFPKEICFSTATAQAQAPSSTYNVQPTIPDFTPVSTLITDHKLPGAVVLIGHNNQIVFHHAYGLRKLPGEPGINGETAAEPMTEDTIFDMASLTSTARPFSTPTSAPHLIPVSASRVEAWGFSPMNYPSQQNGALAPATTQPPPPKTDAEKRAAQKALKGQLHAPYSPPWNGYRFGFSRFVIVTIVRVTVSVHGCNRKGGKIARQMIANSGFPKCSILTIWRFHATP
jgi:Beta-lactamase